MSVRFVLVAALLAACGGSRSIEPPTTKPTPIVARPALDTRDPRDYILGRGVARDYRVALRLYSERCAQGCGDLLACHETLQLAFRYRGVSPTDEHVRLAVRMCDLGDQRACMIAAFARLRDTEGHDEAATAARCDAADLLACETEMALDIPLDESNAAVMRRAVVATRVCLAGKIAGCDRLAPASWTPEITARVEAGCAEGDPDACALLPGKEIAAMSLCEAGDYDVCERLGRDDPAAAAVACAGGRLELCVPPGPYSSARAYAEKVVALQKSCKEGDAASCSKVAKLTAATSCPAK